MDSGIPDGRAQQQTTGGRRGHRLGARPVVGILLAAGLLAGVAPGTAAAAPGEAEIADARAQADQVADRISRLSGDIGAAEAEVAAARAASAIALDTYQATQARFQTAQARAAEAAQAAERARVQRDDARTDVVAFARSSYIDGSSYAGAAALITSRSPAEFIERAALLEAAGSHRTDVLVTMTGLEQVADEADAAARSSLAEAAALEEEASAALAAATSAEAASRTRAAELAVQQEALETELAAAEAELADLLGEQEAADRAAALAEQARQATRSAPRAPAPEARAPAGPGSPDAAATAIEAALTQLGVDYAWGGGGTAGPGWGWGVDLGVWGFDCSGLTQYAYAQAGIGIPRNSRAQYAALPKVSAGSLRAGDLVFWATDPSDPETIHHVALWIGDGTVVQAPQSHDVVKVSPMWWDGYAGAVRPSA